MLLYDDTQLRRMLSDLAPKRRRRALITAIRKYGNKVRKAAVNNLLTSGLGKAEQMTKGIRIVILRKDVFGIRITAAASGGKGFHRNRFGKEKPVLMWAELGTQNRRVKLYGKKTRINLGWRWITVRHKRGAMKRYGFIDKTEVQVSQSASRELEGIIVKKIKDTAAKYGGH